MIPPLLRSLNSSFRVSRVFADGTSVQHSNPRFEEAIDTFLVILRPRARDR
jgi:hypothetical protein